MIRNLILPVLVVGFFSAVLISFQSDLENNTQNSNLFKNKHPQFASKFEDELKGIFKANALYGDFVFAVVDENGLAYSFALNRDILEGKKSSLDNDTPFYIASHTKSFTGTLLKVLDSQEKLDLNNSLVDYIPTINFNGNIDHELISLKAYLNHTHGVFSNPLMWKTAYLGYSGNNSELIDDLNKYSRFDPSHKFRYSNVGPIISGMVVETVTGNSWKTEMKDQIFTKLGMENTSANISDYSLEQILPSYTANSKDGIIAKGIYKNDTTMHAAGGVISTVNDLSKWLQANINQDTVLMSKSSWSEMHASTTTQDKEYFTYNRTGYSLGWDVAEYGDESILTRFGGIAGMSFHASFMPDKKIGIIAFSNDNRAFALPHLMANYAYNLINKKDADEIFEIEKQRWEKSFEREDQATAEQNFKPLEVNADRDEIIGQYKNSNNWPVISVNKKDGLYNINWGALSGNLYENSSNKCFSDFGVLKRGFELKGDTLVTGSLIYTKVEK
jgi:CubicO group peptidase (beta-lactamase class C family)